MKARLLSIILAGMVAIGQPGVAQAVAQTDINLETSVDSGQSPKKAPKLREPFKPQTLWDRIGLSGVGKAFQSNRYLELAVWTGVTIVFTGYFTKSTDENKTWQGKIQPFINNMKSHAFQIGILSVLDKDNIKNLSHLWYGMKNKILGTHDKIVDDRPVAREDLYNLAAGFPLSPYKVEASLEKGLEGTAKAFSKGLKKFIGTVLFGAGLNTYYIGQGSFSENITASLSPDPKDMVKTMLTIFVDSFTKLV